MRYDLLDEPFASCAKADGTIESLGIAEMLREAHAIREISESSPLTSFGVYRLLLAVLHWLHAPSGHAEWTDLWRAGRFPEDLIQDLSCRGRNRFNLLDDRAPFYQDRPVGQGELRPVADILYEVPGDTEINLFRHTVDSRVALCLTCCAKGLLRLPAFGTQGGRGLAPSINNAPPVYFLPHGANLFETLVLNLTADRPEGDVPAWEGRTADGVIGVQEGFTWQPRSVWINPATLSIRECSMCGCTTQPTARELVYRMGRSRKQESHRQWRDPHVAYVSKDRGESELRPGDATAGSRWREWRRSWSVLLPQPDGGWLIESMAIAFNRLSGETSATGQQLGVRGFSLHSRQAKRLHDCQLRWTVPLDLVNHPEAVASLHAALDFAKRMATDWQNWRFDDVSSAVGPSPPRKPRKPTDRRERAIASHRALIAPELERAAEAEFRGLVQQVASAPESHAECVSHWREKLIRLVERCASVAATHDLRPTRFLERIEARRRFQDELPNVHVTLQGAAKP